MRTGALGFLTFVVTVMVVIDALWQPAVLSSALAFPDEFRTYVVPVATSVDAASLIFKIATMIVFSIWIYVAGRNLVNAGYDDLEFSAGSRIWWFAVPIACLFKPFQGMRELWNASRGNEAYDESAGLVAVWWALWLAAGFASYFSSLSARGGSTTGLWIESAVDVALAVAAILLIRGIARGQSERSEANLVEVFA